MDSGWKLKTVVEKLPVGATQESSKDSTSAATGEKKSSADIKSNQKSLGDTKPPNEAPLIGNKKDSRKEKGNSVLSQFLKKTDYEPAVRSPGHIAWLKDKKFMDFQLDVRVHSTHKDYDHRDACLFFGRQSPTKFYYVHLGKKTDPHANQIFIVNDADRKKISLTTTPGRTGMTNGTMFGLFEMESMATSKSTSTT